jgi:hypothetical protein
MDVQVLANAAALAGAALFLVPLYQLAVKKAARSGERALTVFVRALSLLSLVHGLGLCLITAAVLLGVPLLLGPLPAHDRRWMGEVILAGFGLACLGGIGLWATRRLGRTGQSRE